MSSKSNQPSQPNQQAASPPPSNLKSLSQPYSPADVDFHASDLAARQAARDSRRATNRACLDPVVAGQHEARKPLYEWLVECTYSRQNSKGRIETVAASDKVMAQNESDAWAIFCDKRGVWPGRRDSDLKITQLEKAADRSIG